MLVKDLKSDHVYSLLIHGAGIYKRTGRVIADPFFKASGPKANPAARRLVTELARRVAPRGDPVNLLVLFEDRPATLTLGRMLAGELNRNRETPIPVLAIKRNGRELSLSYFANAESKGEHLRLSSSETRRRVTGAKVILFSDLLRAGDHAGTLRVLTAPAVRRHQVEILGIAALAIGETGTRKRFWGVAGNEKLPIAFIMHFEESGGRQEKAEEKEKKGLLKELLKGLFRRGPRPS